MLTRQDKRRTFVALNANLLRVQRGFVSFKLGDQFLGPVNKGLIRDTLFDPAIAFNRLIDFDALIAHGLSALDQAGANALSVIDGGRGSDDDNSNAPR